MRRPTRRDLLIVVGQLQDLIGQAEAEHANDRSPDGFEQGQERLREAHPPAEHKGKEFVMDEVKP